MNFKPSDHGMEDTDPRLDFGAMNRRAGQQPQTRADVKVRMPTGAPVDLKTALEARRLRAEAEAKKNPNAAPARSLSQRQRFDDAFADGRGRSASKKYAKNPTRTLSKKSSTGNASVATASTDAHNNNQASTAATSAAVTSGPSSKRMSRQLDPAALADAQAAEWMRTEREKRGRRPYSPQHQPSTANRAPSRTRSIRDNMKEYFFPGATPSRGLSRSHSIEALRLTNTNASQAPDDTRGSASSGGWRSWGFPLRTNSRASSRPGTSRGQAAEEPEAAKKLEVNLNRELPPLPSLDSCKDEVKPAETKEKSAVHGTHIASVMRPQDKHQDQPYKRSASGSHTMQTANAYPQSPTRSIQSPSHSHQRFDSKKNSPGLNKSEMNQTRSSSGSQPDRPRPHNDHSHHRSENSEPLSPGAKESIDLHNFSRTLSTDLPPAGSAAGSSVTVLSTHKEEQKSRLKKVFSGWMLKKERKEDWMHTIEKEGVKKGVLVHDNGANGPIVRY
jgi:hypothetical protein